MINFDDVVKVKREGFSFKRVFDHFNCEHCDHKYLKQNLDTAIFNYGVFFLVNSDNGYLGTTCLNPECGKNIVLSSDVELIDTLGRYIVGLLDLKSHRYTSGLQHYSSVNFYPDQIKFIKDYDIKHSLISGPSNFQYKTPPESFQEIPTNRYLSYLPNSKFNTDAILSIWNFN